MDIDKGEELELEQQHGQPARKSKEYEKPDVIYRAPLEAMAAVCAPSPGKVVLPCTVINS